MSDTATIDADVTAPVEVAAVNTEPTPTAAQLRRFANETGIPVGLRGRIHPDVVAAFGKANKKIRTKYLRPIS